MRIKNIIFISLSICCVFFLNNTFAQFKLFNWVKYKNAPVNNFYLHNTGLNGNLTTGSNTPDSAKIQSFANSTLGYEIACFDIESWSYSTDSLTKTINKFISTANIFKTINSATPVGYYGAIPQQVYDWDGISTKSSYASWMKVNDSLKRAAAKVDIFFPSAYSRDTNTHNWQRYIDSNVSVVRSLYSTSKPIYIYIWPQYDLSSNTGGVVNKQFIDPVRWKKLLNIIYNTSANGAVIWTSNTDSVNNIINWDYQMPWWTATKEFLLSKSLVLPFRMDTAYLSSGNNAVNIKWETSIDTTAQYFQVERSNDSISFTSVSDPIPSLHNYCLHTYYTFTDSINISIRDKNYYRIKEVFKNDSISYSKTLTYQPPSYYRSLGTGVTVDLGSVANWEYKPSINDSWVTATTSPASAGLTSGSTVTIAAADSWTNAAAITFPASGTTGVTIIDSAQASSTAFPGAINTIAGNTIVFAGSANVPPAGSFASSTTSNTISWNVKTAGTIKTTNTAITLTGDLTLVSGVFTWNNGGGSFVLKNSTGITSTGGSISSTGYANFSGPTAITLPSTLFTTSAGIVNNTIFKIQMNDSLGVTINGPLTTNGLSFSKGIITVTGTLKIGAVPSNTSYPISGAGLTSGTSYIVPGDTVIFQPVVAGQQAIPTGFFGASPSVNNIVINNPAGVTYGDALSIPSSLTIDNLNNTTPLGISGAATIGGKLIISSFATAPASFPATYTIVTGSSLSGTFSSLILPTGYAGTVSYTGTTATLTINQSTTPITSSPITAVNTGKNINLSWTTYTEINSSKFYIQRSSDATSFVTIDSVNAAHTSTSPIKYSYTDKAPLSGTDYYRFKEVDLDGTSTYSVNVAAINFYGGNENIKIYPNPATEGESIVIDLNAVGNYTVKLIDESGKAVQSGDYASTQKISLPTKALSKGVYFVAIYSKGKKISTSSVIIK